jgi:hypothetical protein
MRWRDELLRFRAGGERHTECACYSMAERHTECACYVAKGLVLFCLLCGLAGGPAWAQCQRVVLVPRATGTTPLAAAIRAEAAYVAAYGSMLESAATARKINAEAVALEIQNSIEYVDAYFKCRELNRQWRAKEDPNYLEREKRRQAVVKRRVEEQYQDVLRGDVTKMLNWLLRELSAPVVAYQYLPGSQTLVHSALDQKLAGRDVGLIRLTDGGSAASRLVFAAADGKPLQPHWPLGLRGPECDEARDNYQHTIDSVLPEIKEKGQASYEKQTQMMQDVNALFVALDDAYPKERRAEPTEFTTYAIAKRFLQSLLASTHRAITTNDSHVLRGGARFQGDSVVGLVQHMYQNGLEFAPPEAGGEGVYKSLFQTLRTLYVNIGPDQAPADVIKRLSGGEGGLAGEKDKP